MKLTFTGEEDKIWLAIFLNWSRSFLCLYFDLIVINKQVYQLNISQILIPFFTLDSYCSTKKLLKKNIIISWILISLYFLYYLGI